MDFSHLPLFEVTKTESEEYADWVKKTALLLGRKYYPMHRIFEKENWSVDEIRSAYNNAVKHHGDLPKDVYWWWKRKVRNQNSTP